MDLQELYYLYTMKTNNFRDPQLPKKFEELWEKAAGLFQLEEPIYAIYHDYESDYKGDYAVSIALERPLDGAKSLTVPKQDYAIFPTTREEIPQTWQEIWHLEEMGQLNRLYQLDFEKYESDGKVSIYIGVK
ncbi:GyrI-like domain-containing protein [Streptococcus ferus]|uniref:GyrI-like domain-containing protein n=1 Tax=Streptococcus ferus TaxID=1345 RepID=UPI0035A080D1